MKRAANKPVRDIQHIEVFRKDGQFGGWPANNGIWRWGDEILVGFVAARHQHKETSHTYDPSTALHKFARSPDGGETWSIEDAYDNGIRGEAFDHAIGDRAVPPADCAGSIDFSNPHFAFTFRRMNDAHGPSHFYYSYHRGRSWRGPFLFPDLNTGGVIARTEYIVEGKHRMLAFLTSARLNGREGRVPCVRTEDGGKTWRLVSWVGPDPKSEKGHYSIMPAAARLSPSSLFVVTRHSAGNCGGLTCWRSDDNALTWHRLDAPGMGNLPGQGGDHVNNPPALIKLRDGRLCVTYGVRVEPARMCARLSADEGRTWSDEIILRGNDGANFDMGYPRITQRPDGRVVVVYYYNHALLDGPPYRYIAATIFNPDAY